MAKRRTAKRRTGKRRTRKRRPRKRSTRKHLGDKAIREIVSRVRKLRTKKLPPKMMKVVKNHAKQLHIISDPKVSLKRKRKLLVQKGGMFDMFPSGDPMLWMAEKVAKLTTPLILNKR